MIGYEMKPVPRSESATRRKLILLRGAARYHAHRHTHIHSAELSDRIEEKYHVEFRCEIEMLFRLIAKQGKWSDTRTFHDRNLEITQRVRSSFT